jgi:hypothetical protein
LSSELGVVDENGCLYPVGEAEFGEFMADVGLEYLFS